MIDHLVGEERTDGIPLFVEERTFSHALLAAVVRQPEVELGSAVDRLIAAGLLFRQGVPLHATYLFKHSLVRDAAYGSERARVLIEQAEALGEPPDERASHDGFRVAYGRLCRRASASRPCDRTL
jgi:hypothetical protein